MVGALVSGAQMRWGGKAAAPPTHNLAFGNTERKSTLRRNWTWQFPCYINHANFLSVTYSANENNNGDLWKHQVYGNVHAWQTCRLNKKDQNIQCGLETTKEVCNHASEIKKMPPQTDPYINGEHSDFTEVVSHRWDHSVKNRGNLYHLQNNCGRI